MKKTIKGWGITFDGKLTNYDNAETIEFWKYKKDVVKYYDKLGAFEFVPVTITIEETKKG
jgi:hypothetical protein